MPHAKRLTPYSNFAEGDYVSRAGDDVHLVRAMDDDGYCAEFVCVVAPVLGWCSVGDVEYNLCARYVRTDWGPPRSCIETVPCVNKA